MTNVELRHLRAFLAIAEEGSITAAAARLRVGQPALSRTLRALEDRIGARLVDRSTHHLELTPEGRAFHGRAASAVTAFDHALDPTRPAHRPLRLGHAWSALGRWTTPLLRRWRAEHPGTPLELLRLDDRTAGLLGGRADAALLRGEHPGPGAEFTVEGFRPGELVSTWLLDEPRVAAVPADSELARAAGPLTLADLAGMPIALNTVSGHTTLDLWPAGVRPDASRTVEVANTDDWLGAIAAGGAVGVSTEATAQLHVHPDVRYRPLAGVSPVSLLLVHRAAPVHPAVPALVRLAREVLGGPPPAGPH
ncbi:LysR family transcriptional regulator [Streptomyces sp. HNM0574]|uniref:LysR family transcriptional regulator n=1 Tax=Streptomyces sp. HNM0574 TaxID=2714954 RepID=UPI00146F1EB0|nr:LysR family transcriptional regulator [Streptomyces sp. HNM0574]NLU67209.1 LysR family transcriptional regulator [Streptomyces sp. HNM0574]